MKILFDGTCISKNPAGIGNYAYQLLREFVRDGKHEVSVICRNPEFIPSGDNIDTIVVKSKFNKLLPIDLVSKGRKYDIYHQPNYIPHAFNGKRIITVHDMSHKVYPEYHPKTRIWMMKLYEERMKRADIIVTDSYSSKREIIKYWNISEEKIHVHYLGVDEKYYNYKPSIGDLNGLKKWELPNEYMLYVGTIEPRKNIQNLIKAFEIYKNKEKNDMKLVLAGGKGWLSEKIYEEAEKSKFNTDIIFTGYFPAELKPTLYCRAKVMLYPSSYEGFGLPILEAMATGTKVVTSNLSSMPEVAGNVGIYCNPASVEDIASKIEYAANNKDEFSKEYIIKEARKFSWKKCYNQLIDIYKLCNQI